MSLLANLDKTLGKQLKDPVVSTVVRVVLVLYILMLSSVDYSVLSLFENLCFQIFYFATLAYVAMVDPATAVLMAAAYLFSVQQLNRGLPSEAASEAAHQVPEKSSTPVVTQMPSVTNGPGALVTQMPSEGFASEEGQLVNEGDSPAYRTMTENLGQFTTDAQFKDAQNNTLDGVSQEVGIQSLTNQFSAQGLNPPPGYDCEDNYAKF